MIRCVNDDEDAGSWHCSEEIKRQLRRIGPAPRCASTVFFSKQQTLSKQTAPPHSKPLSSVTVCRNVYDTITLHLLETETDGCSDGSSMHNQVEVKSPVTLSPTQSCYSLFSEASSRSKGAEKRRASPKGSPTGDGIPADTRLSNQPMSAAADSASDAADVIARLVGEMEARVSASREEVDAVFRRRSSKGPGLLGAAAGSDPSPHSSPASSLQRSRSFSRRNQVAFIE